MVFSGIRPVPHEFERLLIKLVYARVALDGPSCPVRPIPNLRYLSDNLLNPTRPRMIPNVSESSLSTRATCQMVPDNLVRSFQNLRWSSWTTDTIREILECLNQAFQYARSVRWSRMTS